jgi:hypothetical protein
MPDVVKKVVLAYSGGLDTSVILRWLQETYRCEVVTFIERRLAGWDAGSPSLLLPNECDGASAVAATTLRSAATTLRSNDALTVDLAIDRIAPRFCMTKTPRGFTFPCQPLPVTALFLIIKVPGTRFARHDDSLETPT